MKTLRIKYIANEIYSGCSNDFIQKLKVDLDSFPTDRTIEIFPNEDNINLRTENSIFINDIDFTQDFTGLNNKEKVIEFLKNNRDFRIQNSYDRAAHAILDIDFKISRNCLTFKKHTNNGDIRSKFYNKCVQSLESPAVRDLVGGHNGDHILNPNLNLKKAIKKSKRYWNIRN